MHGSFAEAFQVRLELFDGPIDLLLHLVKQEELPIEKLSLAQIADQYMGYLEALRDLDLEVAGEYLLIAATLVSIKSSVLLNEPPELVRDEDGALIDPHEELLRRLREAQVYKEGAGCLAGRPVLGVDVFAPTGISADSDELVIYKQHDALLLGRAFMKLLQKSGADEHLLTISVDAISIVERMVTILNTLKSAGGALPFEQLIPQPVTRATIISSFVALLELCKRSAIRVRQEGAFESITIALSGGEVPVGNLTSEFDEEKRTANE